ncbi:MAG: Ig-like domain-containing protein, partial [Gemmatimonadaceae bacterium]
MFFSARSRAFLIASYAFSVAACGGGGDSGGTTTQPGPAANVGVSSTAFTFVAIGASQAVSATVTDANGKSVSGSSLSWVSDNPAVAEVTASGNTATIFARKSGSATVRASSGNASASIGITVLGVKSVTMSSTSATVRVGTEQTLTADVTVDPGVSRSVTWNTSNSSVANVSVLGVVSAVAPGSATISATAVADAGISATADITVIAARGVSVTPATARIGTGNTQQLSGDVILDAGLPTTVTWTTSASGVATVSQQGLVTGVAVGTATITATSTADGTLAGTSLITVAPIVRLVAITAPASNTLFLGQTKTLIAIVTADAGLAQTVNWATSNSAVATVDANGLVSALAPGSADITATSTADITKSASITLAVASQPVSISLSQSSLNLTAGNAATVVATVAGDPGVSSAVTWSTSAPAIATVNNGLITGVVNGTAVITATSVADPTKSATVSVSVGARLASAWTSTGLSGPMIENIISTYVVSGTDVFTVNARGDIFHFDGTSWARTASGSSFGTTFQAVHGSSSTNVIAVGTGGKIVVWNGTSWQGASSGTGDDLLDVWVESPTSAFAVGNNGVAVRLVGSTWSTTSTGVPRERLNGVWAAGNNLWFAVGTNGTLLRFVNGAWSTMASPTSVNLRDVFGNANNDVYAVGEVGTVVWFNGGEWSLLESNGVSSDLYSVTGTNLGGTKIYIGGDRIALRVLNGVVDVVAVDPPYSVQFLSTSIDPSGNLWMGGERGLLLRYSAATWQTMNLAPDLIDVWTTGISNAWAVGEFGFIYRFNGSVWTRQTSSTLTRLNTVWGSSASEAFAGGDVGTIIHWNGSVWSTMTSPTSADILSMWGTSPTNVYATT